ncbi:MAG: hypothetical protein K2X48_03100 [Chitinophagaceae bacterium]|nr:hypothetical protein [Chitinophagaceae bacterium]
MKLLLKYNLFISILLYCILFVVLWPLYRYVFDVDGIGYAMVAKRLAAGDYANAVNGYWSPLHSWLVLPLIKAGLTAINAFHVSNAVIAITVLIIFKKLLLKFSLNPVHETCVLFTAVIMLLQYSYFELAADILLVPFLLLYILLITRDDFYTSIKVQVYCALVATLAYFAKAYALPFILLMHTALFVHHGWLMKKYYIKQWMVFVLLLMVCCSPWFVLLYNKYQFLTFGTSGKLTWTWYLGGAVNTTDFFWSPSLPNSPAWWEDPYYSQDGYLTMFSSPGMFLHQLRVIAFNFQQLLKTYMDLSVFAPAIVMYFFLKSIRPSNTFFQKLLLLTILFPLAYLLIHVETRFFWVFGLLFLAAGIPLLYDVYKSAAPNKWIQYLLPVLLCLSFLIEPVNILKDSAYGGKQTFETAAYLKEHSLQNGFTSNKFASECEVMAFFAEGTYFYINQRNYSYEQLKTEMAKHNIQTFLFYFEFEHEKTGAINELTKDNQFRYEQVKKGLLVFIKQ